MKFANTKAGVLPNKFAVTNSVAGEIFVVVAPLSTTECSSRFETGSTALRMQGRLPLSTLITKVPS